MLDAAVEIVENEGVAERWRRRRNEYVDDTENLTDALVDVGTLSAAIGEVDALSRS